MSAETTALNSPVATYSTQSRGVTILDARGHAIEQRTTLREPSEAIREWFLNGRTSTSGVAVTPNRAMGISAYFACIRAISEDLGKIPAHIVEDQEPRGFKKLPNHPAWRILHDEANPEMSAMSCKETITAHACGRHGGFAEIVRNGLGQPKELWPLDPGTVTVMRNRETHALAYRVRTPGQADVFLPPERMFHIHGLGLDGITGYAIHQIARTSLGRAIAAQQFSAEFFTNGATSTGVIQLPGPLSELATENLRKSFTKRHVGEGNYHNPIILEDGVTWTPDNSTPETSQLHDTMMFSVEDIARWFRMPPHKIQHLLRATYSNIDAQNVEYVVDCLLSWIVRWEQEVKRKLIGFAAPNAAVRARFNVRMLLRGDLKTQSQFYREQFNIGALSQNEIRELEGHNPIGPEGDILYVPLNMRPATEEARAAAQSKAAPPEKAREPSEDAVGATNGNTRARSYALVVDAHTGALANILSRVLRIEHDKVLRAHKPGAVAAFYEEHEQYVRDAISDAVRACAVSLDGIAGHCADAAILDSECDLFLAGLVARHIKRSLTDTDDKAKVAKWLNGRATVEAAQEVRQLAAMVESLTEDRA